MGKWVADDEGRLKREKIASMTRRCSAHDYREKGIYQITLTLADRRADTLGRIVVKAGPSSPVISPGAGQSFLT